MLQVALLRLACIRTWDVTYGELSHGLMRVESIGLGEFFSDFNAWDLLSGKATWSYMIKPHGSLVLVSSALLRYTPNLSTT